MVVNNQIKAKDAPTSKAIITLLKTFSSPKSGNFIYLSYKNNE